MVKRYHLISIALLISVIGSSDEGTKNVRRSLGFSQSNETEKSVTYDSAYVGKVEVKIVFICWFQVVLLFFNKGLV